MVTLSTTIGQDATKDDNKMHYIKDDHEYIDIHEYANMTHRSVAAVRASIEQGNRVRKMRAIRVGSRYYVLSDEYHVFPYINKGKGIDRVYHFGKDGELILCDQCTNGGSRCSKVDEEGYWNGQQ